MINFITLSLLHPTIIIMHKGLRKTLSCNAQSDRSFTSLTVPQKKVASKNLYFILTTPAVAMSPRIKNNHCRIQHLRPVYALLSHLSSVLPDTLPQWLQHTVKRFNTIGCGCFGKSCQGKSSDCTHLLLFINQTYRMRRRRRFE